MKRWPTWASLECSWIPAECGVISRSTDRDSDVDRMENLENAEVDLKHWIETGGGFDGA